MQQRRKEQRRISNGFFTLTWHDSAGQAKSSRAQCINVSKSGLRLETAERLDPGVAVSLHGEHQGLHVRATVRYCTRHGSSYAIGLEFGEAPNRDERLPMACTVNRCEGLPLSSN